MSASSTIEWTDATWNPVTGCDHVSLGCDNCYAERIATRFGRPFLGAVELHPERLSMPSKWRKPRRVFVNSVSDLFHDDVPTLFIAQVFAAMMQAEKHTFQVLTKRPQRMRKLTAGPDLLGIMAGMLEVGAEHLAKWWPVPNVWLGVSVEDERYARIRIPRLLETPAAVRFLSVEPMLAEVDLAPYLDHGIGWVIVGGESGPNARPIEAEWVRTLRDQCVAASVPFFFKQWGGRTPKARGRELDGRVWDEYPIAKIAAGEGDHPKP
jgi:protein gp37